MVLVAEPRAWRSESSRWRWNNERTRRRLFAETGVCPRPREARWPAAARPAAACQEKDDGHGGGSSSLGLGYWAEVWHRRGGRHACYAGLPSRRLARATGQPLVQQETSGYGGDLPNCSLFMYV